MKIKRHGISIGIERQGNDIFARIKAYGKLTHDDYELMVPVLESAIAGIDKPSIRALIDATEFEGWEPRAAWDDLKIGLKHGRAFSKMAIVSHSKWMKYAAATSSWFTSGEVKTFEDMDEALAWLCQD